ncbi:hypothetical protein [Rhizobium chutanense]|uniref:hypothetical protein n=1 Tax=Rhizobium chutanense TaxID=2035448 RepID=UPI00117A0C2D|nr:hypothetical protein [Rhizobium chutanense]
MTTIDKIANVERMIAIVRGKIASIPSIEDAGDISVQAAEKRVKMELTREFGASFSFRSGGYHVYLSGVGATCTAGYSGLFRNWEMAARRKIMMLRVVARGTARVAS